MYTFSDIYDRKSEHQSKVLSETHSYVDGPLLRVTAPMMAGKSPISKIQKIFNIAVDEFNSKNR